MLDPHGTAPVLTAVPPLPAGLPDGVDEDRRGREVEVVGSYWSRRERQVRASVFQRRAAGSTVAQISAETDLTEHEVQAVLLSDRRARS